MIGNPRCQCGERLTAHPGTLGHGFRQRLARGAALKRTARKSKHSAFAAKLGLRRSKSIGTYKKRLWVLFSEFIRRRRADENGMVKCCTCETVAHWKEVDAGHYHPRTDGNSLFFDERNVNEQCGACNRFRRGNLTRYALFLIATYGPNILSELDTKRREFRKISEPEYLELIAAYQKKLAAM